MRIGLMKQKLHRDGDKDDAMEEVSKSRYNEKKCRICDAFFS
jgi:hypothetical protein